MNFDQKEFHDRWLKARISAIGKAAPSENLNGHSEFDLIDQYFSTFPNSTPEENTKKKDSLLRNIFDHSRALAISLSKHLGLSFEIGDFQDLLSKSQIPCYQGQWEARSTARILTRNGCDSCKNSGANACDYWREAVDGLVMGLGEKERFARHASMRHGDSSCVDVLFFESETTKENLALGPIPDHMAPNIQAAVEEFERKMNAPIILKGLSEGILYFEFKASNDNMCGSGNLLTLTFQRKVQKFYPGLSVKEVSPCAVLGVET